MEQEQTPIEKIEQVVSEEIKEVKDYIAPAVENVKEEAIKDYKIAESLSTKVKYAFKAFLLKYGHTILFLLVTFFLIFSSFKLIIGSPAGSQEVQEVHNNVQVIEKKVDSLNATQNFLMSRIYQMEENQLHFSDAINKNNMLIERNNQQLSKLKRIYNEKTTVASHYNYSQLDSFFAKRYQHLYGK